MLFYNLVLDGGQCLTYLNHFREMNIYIFLYIELHSNDWYRLAVSPLRQHITHTRLCYIYRLLTVYRKIFGTISYDEGCTSLLVHLRHMNECRILYDIQSKTFLLYTLVIVIYDW